MRFVIGLVDLENSLYLFLVNTGDCAVYRRADLKDLFPAHAGFPGQGALNGCVRTAPEKETHVLHRKIAAVSEFCQSVIDGRRQVLRGVQDRSVHIENNCFVAHITVHRVPSRVRIKKRPHTMPDRTQPFCQFIKILY